MGAVVHSHRPTTKVGHKPFKSRKATKGQLREVAKGRVERTYRKTLHQHVMSKLDRRNQAKQRQIAKAREHQKETSIFSGRDGAPRIVAIIPLCEDGDARLAVERLNESVDIETEAEGRPGGLRVTVDRFKQKLQYIALDRDLTAFLDAARTADFVVLILSAAVPVDPLGELILRAVESQGLSTLYTAIHGLEKVESAKQRQAVVGSLKSYITHFHPEQDKLFSLDSRQECSNLMRALCSTTPRGVHWRDKRSWMVVDHVRLPPAGGDSTVVVTGVIRGQGLKADRLVQLGDIGTFKIEKIAAAPLPSHQKGDESMALDESPEIELDTPGEDQDDLADLAPEEVVMDEDAASTATTRPKGVLLDDHHYFSEEEDVNEEIIRKRVPKGTSKYQAAWYLGGDDDAMSEDGSEFEYVTESGAGGAAEAANQDAAAPQDGLEGRAQTEMMDTEPSEYPQSEMVMEPTADDDAQQLAAYRARKKRDEAEDDKEFPDEIELHPNVLARERLIRYRGLKSLRTSPWAEDEDRAHEPDVWRRLLTVSDYRAALSRSAREALDGGVAAGTRVHIYLQGVPTAELAGLCNSGRPITLFSLLRHEHKRTVVNYLITLSSDSPTSLRSKEELIIQCGPRRHVARVMFSQPGATPNDVHKSCRFLHPGQSAVASFIGPLTWGSVPTLFFKKTGVMGNSSGGGDGDGGGGGGGDGNGDPALGITLVGTGTALPPSLSRVVVKRAILTGHPYHMHRKTVTIRYMFFNREDVNWFKALPLWTRRGRTGYIKESIGTHGYFKATFDGKINPQDAIGVSLYKRVFPHQSEAFRGVLLDGAVASQGEAI